MLSVFCPSVNRNDRSFGLDRLFEGPHGAGGEFGMYYVLVILSVAASAAFSNLVGEVGSEYFANYLVDNEPNDLGVKVADPAAADATKPTDAAVGRTAAADPKVTGDG